MEKDAGAGLFVAGKKATKANGATRFIPSSHLWDCTQGPPTKGQCLYTEINHANAFMVLSACFQGGSANTITDRKKLVYSLANDIEEIKKLPE